MNGLKGILFLFACFTFLVSIALAGSNLTFYFKHKEMYQNPELYTKKYVLLDSSYSVTIGSKNKRNLNYGLSKKFDNYKTIFNLNAPDGDALFEDEVSIETFPDTLSQSIFYYAWVNKQEQMAYICNPDEESIQDNWIFMDKIFNIKLTIAGFIFSLIIFYWLKVYKIFQK
ncbi:hypothetical protein KHA90_19535 [Flavobacterium psychroterrae]|uniref:DUF3592 domain-containing protein n=1 Tax=Flavobacterium psychroterrae TaxID=2133767 RepID=A0ABS5PHA9_9FLAO|nr:hypothetical protein [Flavobacterium psychroterrae]MBS7233215.1 hypothetical protein [Flavobacterium psychroterrae]